MFTKKNLSTLFFLSCIYVALIAVWGYQFGQDDLTQEAPLALYAHDHSLYPHDFYIQNAIQHTPNERSFFMLLLTPFGKYMEYTSMLFDYLFTILLLWGLLKLADTFFEAKIFSWITLLIIFFPFYYHTLGDNELYDSNMGASLAEQAFEVWAIVLWLRNKYVWCFILLIVAALMHPLGGLQVFLLITGSSFFYALSKKEFMQFAKKILPLVVLYIFTAGAYIYSISRRFNDVDISNNTLYHIFFLFRNAHHYIPSYYPLKDWIILTPLYCLVPFVLYKANRKLFIFSLLIISGCIVYTIGVGIFHNTTIAAAQWFKSTMWLEFLAVTCLCLVLQNIFPRFKYDYHKALLLLCIAGCTVSALVILPGISKIQNDTDYDIPFARKITPAIDISKQAKLTTPNDALFILPCSFSELKYYGERSSYVDFKALTHRKSFMLEWAKRYEDVYGIDPATSTVVSFDAVSVADENYKNLTADYILNLKKQFGITHMITFKNCNLPFKLIAENSAYKIYEL